MMHVCGGGPERVKDFLKFDNFNSKALLGCLNEIMMLIASH